MNDIDRTIKNSKIYYEISYEISEKDFYPPEDNRLYQSGINDIRNGDNFSDYVKWFYNMYENEIFDN